MSQYINLLHPDHVIVKLYQTIEIAGSRDHAKAQIQSALSHGCTVGGYVWLYANVDAHQQVGDALSLAAEAGVTLPLLWIDVETYQNSLPGVAQIQAAVDACTSFNIRAGIYTGKWVWDLLGNPQGFRELPLWHAAYQANQPVALPQVNYGGWTTPVQHQWTSTPIDRNIIDSRYT